MRNGASHLGAHEYRAGQLDKPRNCKDFTPTQSRGRATRMNLNSQGIYSLAKALNYHVNPVATDRPYKLASPSPAEENELVVRVPIVPPKPAPPVGGPATLQF
jgi:hypothetical protein